MYVKKVEIFGDSLRKRLSERYEPFKVFNTLGVEFVSVVEVLEKPKSTPLTNIMNTAKSFLYSSAAITAAFPACFIVFVNESPLTPSLFFFIVLVIKKERDF